MPEKIQIQEKYRRGQLHKIPFTTSTENEEWSNPYLSTNVKNKM